MTSLTLHDTDHRRIELTFTQPPTVTVAASPQLVCTRLTVTADPDHPIDFDAITGNLGDRLAVVLHTLAGGATPARMIRAWHAADDTPPNMSVPDVGGDTGDTHEPTDPLHRIWRLAGQILTTAAGATR